MRHRDEPIVPRPVGVIHTPDVALGEGLVLASDFVQAFAAQRHLWQRGVKFAVERAVTLQAGQAVNQAVSVVIDAKGLIQVQGVTREPSGQFDHAGDERPALGAAGRADLGKLDGRAGRPFPPEQFLAEGVSHSPWAQFGVERMLRITAKIVHVRHHTKAQPMSLNEKTVDARLRVTSHSGIMPAADAPRAGARAAVSAVMARGGVAHLAAGPGYRASRRWTGHNPAAPGGSACRAHRRTPR